MKLAAAAALAVLSSAALPGAKKPKVTEPTPLERYIQEANARPARETAPLPGSLWSPGARLSDLARDPRASQVDDIVTILVVERASAVATGATKSARTSSANASVSAFGGITRAVGPLANLAGGGSETELDGQGTTTRETVLTTTLSARVAGVLPNGNLVVEGFKDIQVNSEKQRVIVRGVVRPTDIARDNTVSSQRIAQMEVQLNGKGVVGDAIRRPFILYRLLMGILPF